MAKQFRCHWHIETVENITDCAAHLAEGRCGPCPYRTAKAAAKRCADYGAPRKMLNDIMVIMDTTKTGPRDFDCELPDCLHTEGMSDEVQSINVVEYPR